MPSINNTTSRRSVKFPVMEYIGLFTPIALLIVIAGFSISFYRTEAQISTLIDEDNTRLQHISGFIGAHMSSTFNHLQSISNETETQNAIDSNKSEAIKSLQNALLTLARRNPVYEQVRWIDETGSEQIRISRDPSGPYAEIPEKLQDKNQRYYFTAANSLSPGELYASRIDLNMEHGKIEFPVKPVLRVATPLMNRQGNRRGIIIINILMTDIFNTAKYLEQEDRTGNYILLNQQADLIHGSIHKPAVNQSNESASSFSLAYPAVWEKISASESSHLELSDEIWTWKTISSFDNLIGFKPHKTTGPSSTDKPVAGEFTLIFVVQRPLRFMLDMRSNIRVSTFSIVFIVLFVYGISLFFYLSGKFRARRAELEATYAMAHASNMTRLKELEERFRRLVDSSNVGQLVVDEEGIIEISNATVEQMLGYKKTELIGTPVETLLPANLQQSHLVNRANFMKNPQPRKMGEGRKLEALRRDGTTIPVEIGLNPYTDLGRQLVLVNVIELSLQTT